MVVDLEVGSATVLVGAEKYLVAEECIQIVKDLEDAATKGGPVVPRGLRIVASGVYPSLISALTKWHAWRKEGGDEIPKPSFLEFVELPEALWDVWSEVVYKLNPHWVSKPSAPTSEQEIETRKKAGSSTKE